jgi:acetylornithine deacetylase
MIERLIAFDTTSRNSNLALIHDAPGYLAGHGIGCHLTHDPEARKANLYATLRPTDRPGIALSGHTNVMPVDGQDWSSDPGAMVEQNGRLYGRDSCDMKGFIAVALSFVPRFLAREIEAPVHLCLSYDEEVSCLGVRRLLALLVGQPVKPKACIIGEPTEMKVVTAPKGKLSQRCRLRGRQAHSALASKGVNAIDAAAQVITRPSEMARQKADRPNPGRHATQHRAGRRRLRIRDPQPAGQRPLGQVGRGSKLRPRRGRARHEDDRRPERLCLGGDLVVPWA